MVSAERQSSCWLYTDKSLIQYKTVLFKFQNYLRHRKKTNLSLQSNVIAPVITAS